MTSAWVYTILCLSWLTTCPPLMPRNPTGLYETKEKCIEAGLQELERQHRPTTYAFKCDEVYRKALSEAERSGG